MSVKSDIHTSWAATLSELADSDIKLFNSTHDKVCASCFLARSWRFLFSRSFTFSGGRECGYDTPEKARKEPVNLGSSIGGMLLNGTRSAPHTTPHVRSKFGCDQQILPNTTKCRPPYCLRPGFPQAADVPYNRSYYMYA